jgi:predicted metal-dependent hydrolase
MLFPASITLDGYHIPVKVIRERRTSFRAATGKDGFILRLPKRLIKSEEQRAWTWFETWAKQLHQDKPDFIQRFVGKNYADGDTVQVGSRRYSIGISLEERASHSAKLHPNRYIQLNLVRSVSTEERNKAAATLLSRVVAKDFLPEFSRRVEELNRLYFSKSIKSINFKNTSSRWGSCSNTGNLNFSTRLLFAPPDVVDYVIIHELAHLIEMNHSDRFWALVAQAMPEYKEKEKWLKVNGSGLGF